MSSVSPAYLSMFALKSFGRCCSAPHLYPSPLQVEWTTPERTGRGGASVAPIPESDRPAQAEPSSLNDMIMPSSSPNAFIPTPFLAGMMISPVGETGRWRLRFMEDGRCRSRHRPVPVAQPADKARGAPFFPPGRGALAEAGLARMTGDTIHRTIQALPAWLGLKGPAPQSWPDRAWAVFTASAGWGTGLARLTPVKLGPRDNRALPWGANPLYRRSSPLGGNAPEGAGPPRMPATGDRLPGWMEGFGAGSFLRRPLTLRSGHDKITG
jgi:hypothetical protein